MKFQYIIFDLDGTLDDRMPAYTDAFSNIARRYGVDAASARRFYESTAGTPVNVQFSEMFQAERVDADVAACVMQFRKSTRNVGANPFPYAKQAVQKLASDGRKIYVTTGSETEEAKSRLREIGIFDSINLVMGSDIVEKGPDHIKAFMSESKDLEFARRSTYVGDGPSDMRIASRFGILPIGISTTLPGERLVEAGARYVISDLQELEDLFEKLEKSDIR